MSIMPFGQSGREKSTLFSYRSALVSELQSSHYRESFCPTPQHGNAKTEMNHFRIINLQFQFTVNLHQRRLLTEGEPTDEVICKLTPPFGFYRPVSICLLFNILRFNCSVRVEGANGRFLADLPFCHGMNWPLTQIKRRWRWINDSLGMTGLLYTCVTVPGTPVPLSSSL